MNIDIHIIINMNNDFGVGDHFQVLRVSEGTYVFLKHRIDAEGNTVLEKGRISS